MQTKSQVRIFKFQDPISCFCVHQEHNLLFTGGWDKLVKAIDLKSGEVDRSFVASREAIKCLHLFDKYLFVAGIDPVIRGYDLTTGAVLAFQGHTSWVLCMTTHVSDRVGAANWLLSGGDEGSIRIWNI